MKKKKLYLLSPSDRFNYGDMIFPYILQYYLGDVVSEIVNCSSTLSDLSDKGGMPTLAFDELYKADAQDDNYLIVAGGESLFTTWPVILSFIYKDVAEKVGRIEKLPRIPFLYRAYQTYIRYYVSKHYATKSSFPFTIGLSEIPNFKAIMYNSVGAVCLSENKDIIKSRKCKSILKSSAYVSVRDTRTSAALKEMEVKHQVCPDSAILMSEIFSDAFLESHKSIDCMPYRKSKYAFFQINMLSAQGNEHYFGEMLGDIYRKYNVNFVFCPIGTALRHSDDVALKAVAKYMPEESYSFVNSPNLWDIMYLIKNSRLYIGTSLHGAITALSYRVPVVTHGKKKVEQYLTNWGG